MTDTTQQTELEGRITGEDFRKIVAEAQRQSGLAAEYQGNFGAWVKTNADRYEIPASQFKDALKMVRMDQGKRHSRILGTLQMWELMGFLDPGETDLFSDLWTLICRAADRYRAAQEGPAEDAPESNGAERLHGLKVLDDLANQSAA